MDKHNAPMTEERDKDSFHLFSDEDGAQFAPQDNREASDPEKIASGPQSSDTAAEREDAENVCAEGQPADTVGEENEADGRDDGSRPETAEAENSAETSSAVTSDKALPYHERYYLKYRGGKRCCPLDLAGTKDFLQEMGFDGGELRQARKGKNQAENFRNADKGKNNQMYCSYCGTEIAGVEFYRLPDGRMRCTSCSSTVIKDKVKVKELCDHVITNLDDFFGAAIDVPVSIEILDERKLKKKIGASLGTKDDQSMLILGVAINKKKKYSILLENGAPRISLIATFAHELTHIWQYTHWDCKKSFKKCSESKRILIYEGMAKWVEIQYLYLIGETNAAKREEHITENRQDEYGIGFRLYESRYPLSRETMSCEDTPFTTDCYPL